MLGLAFLALTIAAGPSLGQEPPQDPPATTLEEVVVEGRSLREAVNSFVDDVTAPPPGRGPARWRESVCVAVVNLRRDAAQALADRVSAMALEVGLEPGEPGCRPNILLLATNDGQGLARALVAEKPRAFRPQHAGAARNAGALERFQAADAPVRWWHVGIPVVRESGRAAVRLPGGTPPLVQGGTRLRTELGNDLLRVFVIIDIDGAEGLTVQQLGDYVGMVALAQIDPDADTSSYDTVLNLFTPDARQTNLTDWDSAYLAALYEAELRQRNPNHQAGEISSLMARDRRNAESQVEDEPE